MNLRVVLIAVLLAALGVMWTRHGQPTDWLDAASIAVALAAIWGLIEVGS